MSKVFWLPALAGLALLAGCDEEHPAECDLAAKGEFVFSVVPRLPSPVDSTADVEMTVNAVLDTIIATPNFIPPLITYRFTAVPPGSFGTRDIRLNDVLVGEEPDAAKRGFPV